jgi:hypothetical protein
LLIEKINNINNIWLINWIYLPYLFQLFELQQQQQKDEKERWFIELIIEFKIEFKLIKCFNLKIIIYNL